MLWFLPEFSSVLHPACHGRSQKLGGPASILREARWGGGVGVAGRFWGVGGGLAQKEKSPDFRCPEVGISAVDRWINGSVDRWLDGSVEHLIFGSVDNYLLKRKALEKKSHRALGMKAKMAASASAHIQKMSFSARLSQNHCTVLK